MSQKDVGNKVPIYKLKKTDEVMKYYDEWGEGNKYDKDRNIKPQEPDALTCDKAKSATIFKEYRDRVTRDSKYKRMRKMWREYENHNLQEIQ